jgi:hypothetical protein
MIEVWAIVGIVVCALLFMLFKTIRGVRYWKRCEVEYANLLSNGYSKEEALLTISTQRHPELLMDTHKAIIEKFGDLPLLVNFIEGALFDAELSDNFALEILRDTTIQYQGPNKYKVRTGKTKSEKQNT